FDRVAGVARLQRGIDFGGLIDLQCENRDGLRRKSLGSNRDAVAANGQEANGVGAGIVRYFVRLYASRDIFRGYFGFGYNSAGLICDHARDGASNGLSEK